MRSRVVFYEYEALKEYDDIDVEPTTELGTIKIWKYHLKDEKITRSMHSSRFDPDRLYEFLIAMIGGDCSFDAVKSEGYKGKELVEEEEDKDPEEDPKVDISKVSYGTQPIDASDESNSLKFPMGETKPVYSSSSSYPTIGSQGSNPSSRYPSCSASLQSGALSGIWSSPPASKQ
ncbi:hypothetical protein PIB30_030450 [Stylosanthes scabra]|uniref:Uncharacterized protein n=1 Tax=Stylosanthes scabra TaxID=79078 RepID=A0ABU6SBN7_9FABA|nr:hypothetical protein [Stylosanthes scabra]